MKIECNLKMSHKGSRFQVDVYTEQLNKCIYFNQTFEICVLTAVPTLNLCKYDCIYHVHMCTEET